MAEEDVVISTDVDDGPLLSKFDKMGEKVGGWASKVEAMMGKAHASILARSSAISESLKNALSGGTSGNVGSSLGESIGSLAAVLPGPLGLLAKAVGPQLGKKIGEMIGDHLGDGMTGHMSGLSIAMDEIAPALTDASYQFDRIKDAGTEAFNKIRESLKEIDFSQSPDKVKSQIMDSLKVAGSAIDDFAAESTARIVGWFDRTFNLFKEPLAGFADSVQNALVQLGLVDQGTTKWGDGIRGISNAGEQMAKGFITGLAYIKDGFTIAFGYITEYVIVPYLHYVEFMLKQLRNTIELLGGLAKAIGKGDLHEKMMNAMGTGINSVVDFRNGLSGKAQDWQNTKPGSSAEPMLAALDAFLNRGKVLQQIGDNLFIGKFSAMMTNALMGVGFAAPGGAMQQGTITAVAERAALAGSREATEAMARSAARMIGVNNPNVQEKIANKLDAQDNKLGKMIEQLNVIAKNTGKDGAKLTVK